MFRFEAVTLTLHEGTPGHHYQFEFNRQQTELPKFMVNPMFSRSLNPLKSNVTISSPRYSEAPSRFPMNTAHVEGWGLYSEYLGFEMGLYQTDLYARYTCSILNPPLAHLQVWPLLEKPAAGLQARCRQRYPRSRLDQVGQGTRR